MKKISLKTIYKTLLLGGCVVAIVSCKKSFEKLPTDTVDVKNAYQNVYDANAAVMGIYGKLMTIADKYIVLNELRADLVSPTANADIYLRQLNEHTEGTDNPWVDPKPWYNLILNMNDAMYHFTDMYKNGRLNTSDYRERYADVGTLRCWVYLQMGMQYGDKLRYVTDPLSTLDALKDSTKYPAISFQSLVKKLATFMTDSTLSLDPYTASNPITGSTSSSLGSSGSTNLTIDGLASTYFFVNKLAVAGDICLWEGAYDATYYQKASTFYRKIYQNDDDVFGPAQLSGNNLIYFFERYKVPVQTPDISGVSTGGLSISYKTTPGTPDPTQPSPALWDSNTLGWRQIFGDPGVTGTNLLDEFIWQLPFVNTFAPADPFIDLFSPRGGKYLLKPSQRMMDLWDGTKNMYVTQANGLNYDSRGKIAVKTLDGQLVNMKQLYYYLNGTTLQPTNPLQKTGKWTLFRGGTLMEHFAEAAANDNQVLLGYAMLNKGINSVFRPSTDKDSRNVNINLGGPYSFDARSGGPTGFLGGWYREAGTRTRARLTDLPSQFSTDKTMLEDAIITENARELGFEGYRWGDLVRVSIRRGNWDFLASKVRDKLIADGNPSAAAAAYAKIMSPGGAYLPFKL